MDTPKRQVSLLESLPPDIWAYLVCDIPGEQLGRLLMTGATLLWQRLKFPNVVKSIKLGEDYLVFKSIPAFLRELPSIEEVVIDSGNYEWSDKLGIKLDLLPSGLRKLELIGKWNQSACTLFNGAATTLTLGGHLPRLEVLNLYDLPFPDLSWMTSSPQSLTKLSLNGWNGSVELPSSLIDFDACHVKVSAESFVSKLPSSLASFVVRGTFIGVDLVLPLLPPSTRELALGYRLECFYNTTSPKKLVGLLPKSLVELSFPFYDHLKYKLDSKPQVISLLPLTLTELKLDTFLPCAAWHLLPQQLTKLSLKAPETHCTVTSRITDANGIEMAECVSVPFDSFPRSLTSLKLKPILGERYFCGPPNAVSHPSYFPPQLTYLSIPDIHLSTECAKLLPSSLTYLKVANLYDRVCQHLPNRLKTLISSGTLMSPNLIRFLPNSLTFLHLSLSGPYTPWFDNDTGEPFDNVYGLAEYTIHKKCTSEKHFDWKDFSALPATLTSLCIRDADNQLGDSFLKYRQLPNLLELNLEDSNHFTDLSIPLLSPRLTTLNLSSSHMVSGQSFPYLPKSLTFLNLFYSDAIFDPDIQHLPRTLQELHLGNAMHLTDLCVPDLPPLLNVLDLRYNAQITPSSLPSLPYPLRSSQHNVIVRFAKWTIPQKK